MRLVRKVWKIAGTSQISDAREGIKEWRLDLTRQIIADDYFQLARTFDRILGL